MNDREYLEWIAYKITMTKNWDKKCEILQIFVENKVGTEVKRLREEVNNLNVIIDTEREKVYDIAQKLLEVIE